jgi:sec-independent protein translocase protein TatB
LAFVFGLSFAELVVVIIVALVVIGPHELPKVLRKLGQWAGKLRRVAADLRSQSGIDDVLREGNLGADINEIRKLARGEISDLSRQMRVDEPALAAQTAAAIARSDVIEVLRDREHPKEGPDGYGALPDTAIVYAETLPRSTFADDDVFTMGVAAPALDDMIPEVAPAADEPRAEDATEPRAEETTEPRTEDATEPRAGDAGAPSGEAGHELESGGPRA